MLEIGVNVNAIRRPKTDLGDRLAAVLLGTAVGDALGLPAENLPPKRIRRWWNGHWQMRFLFGCGMISDDTEHTLMVAQALLSHPTDQKTFQKALGWKLRWWFAALPGGVGLATAKACLRLWIGFPANKAAVKSAGSGPAMRSAIIGAYFAREPERRREFVLSSSRLTHRGWQAEAAAQAVAECAAIAVRKPGPIEVATVVGSLRAISKEGEWLTTLSRLESSLEARQTVGEFVRSLGLEKGVSGYSLHVVPVAIYAWLRHQNDFQTTLVSVLDCGGDTDTVGAIAGALAGTQLGAERIPREWLNRLIDWPRSRKFIERLASRLADQKMTDQPLGPVGYFWPGVLPRNVVFLAAVLAHGFRRLAPPY